MRVCMAPEINFSIECSITDVTWKRFETRMFSAVCDEVGRLAKRLPTLQTLVRLLARVNIGVLLHVRFLMKSLAAVVTRERSCIRMDKHVRRQRGGSFEWLITLFAFERSLVRVNFLVLFQANGVAECFPANVARKRAPSGVRTSHVYFQAVRRAKHFFAVQTVKGLTIVCLFRFLLFACVRLGRSTCKHLGFVRHVRKLVSKEGRLPVGKRKSSICQERLRRKAHVRGQKKWIESIRHKLGGKTRKIRPGI